MTITTTDQSTATWTTGWSAFEPFVLGGAPHYLAYKIASGEITIDRIRADGSGVDTIFSDTWSTGWTSLVPFLLGGQPTSLEYKADTGQVSIDRFKPDGKGVDTLYSDTWSTGWTSFMPFVLGDRACYLAYKVDTGQVTIDRIKEDGSGVDTLYGATWATGWTSFVPFVVNGQPHYICYKRDSGDVSIDRIKLDGSGVETVTSQSWSTGWTAFAPFVLGGDTHYLGYKAGTGQVTVDRIRADASGVDTQMSATWSTDWSSVICFTNNGTLSYLVYKITTGDVAIGTFTSAAATTAGSGPAMAPARDASAAAGRAFFDQLASENVDAVGKTESTGVATRDARFVEQLVAGNMPDFCRRWAEVPLAWSDPDGTPHTGKVRITPDCLAVGSNDDWLRIAVNGYTAQRIANRFGCLLPTPAILRAAFLQTTSIRLVAHPLRAYGGVGANAGDGQHQASNLALRWHEDIIQGRIACATTTAVPPEIPPQFNPQLGVHGSPPSCTPGDHPPDQILIGHKKEVVIPYVDKRLTFWGFYKGNSLTAPAFYQTGDTPHFTGFTDYAQGVRLVHPTMEIDGSPVDYAAVLTDPVRYRAVHDAPLTAAQIRYPESP